MRFVVLLALIVGLARASDQVAELRSHREALEVLLKKFQVEAPRGWSFTQTTKGDGHSRVERYDASQPDFNRWTLLQEDDRSPTADELQDYKEKLSRRSRGGTAPNLSNQLDLNTLALIANDNERSVYRMRLKPAEDGDATAKFLQASIAVNKTSRTIESFELSSVEPFAPTFGVRIAAMKTTMTFSLPDAERPALLQSSVTHLQGRAFLLKSLDADLTVTFTDYEKVGRRSK